MKYYVIEDTAGDWDRLFIVKAENKKLAFKHFWTNTGYDDQNTKDGYSSHYKKDFAINELESLLEDDMTILA